MNSQRNIAGQTRKAMRITTIILQSLVLVCFGLLNVG